MYTYPNEMFARVDREFSSNKRISNLPQLLSAAWLALPAYACKHFIWVTVYKFSYIKRHIGKRHLFNKFSFLYYFSVKTYNPTIYSKLLRKKKGYRMPWSMVFERPEHVPFWNFWEFMYGFHKTLYSISMSHILWVRQYGPYIGCPP